MDKLRVLDLFSGIGGFSLGLERTGGFETVAFCEIEEFPRKVLAKHWPDVPIFEDVRQLNAKILADTIGVRRKAEPGYTKQNRGGSSNQPLGGGENEASHAFAGKSAVDVICGGYPCQPFSTAGQRRGQEDDRHLWPEFNRLVAELRPTWVIGENVAGHISMGLDDVLSDLEGQGYACRTFVIPACAVDAPHRRDRVWTVAHAANFRRPEIKDEKSRRKSRGSIEARRGEQFSGVCVVERKRSLAHPAQLQRNDCGDDRQQGKRQVSQSGIGSGAEPMADAISIGQPRQGESPNTSNQTPNRKGQTGNALDERGRCEWRIEPPVGRVANGVPRRVDRLKALGNAVVPQIPEMIGRAILEAEHG